MQPLQDLVRRPSLFKHKFEAVDFVHSRLDSMGIDTVSVPFDLAVLTRLPAAQKPFSAVQGRRNLVARLPGRGGGRSLVLNCHLDVVPAGDEQDWRHPPFAGQVKDGGIYGRGAYDDKAGAAICLALLESLAVCGGERRGDLIVHFVLEDECTGNGSLLCLEGGHEETRPLLLMARGSTGAFACMQATAKCPSASKAPPNSTLCSAPSTTVTRQPFAKK